MENFKLNNGVEMPAIGLGTFPMNKFELISAVRNAVKVGYKSFDTSPAYANEKALGWGIKLSKIKRKNCFITTKISNSDQLSGSAEEAVLKSLKRLNTEYIDLYLIHWPVPETYLRIWKEMETLYKKGIVRAIGVCNCHTHHLKALLDISEVIPAINQIELHPLLSQKEIVELCDEKGIRVEAYSPFARMDKKLIDNNMLLEIANKYEKKVVQVILRWNYQNSIISIPKTKNIQRMSENRDIFDFLLTKKEMEIIDNLNQNYRTRHDPDNCDFSKL